MIASKTTYKSRHSRPPSSNQNCPNRSGLFSPGPTRATGTCLTGKVTSPSNGENVVRALLLRLIRIYQSHISPYKGFRCAYAAHGHARSCSSFGFLAIERHGVVAGWKLLRRRLARCSHASRRDAVHSRSYGIKGGRQRGYCDLPIGDCDFGHGCHAADVLDCSSCDDGGCIGRTWKRLRRRRPAHSFGHRRGHDVLPTAVKTAVKCPPSRP